ncbi:MAG: DUF2726 domain-containing protein [Fimbriimonadaceae bacterium]|nr:DUF2726 domain-containing protein [Fimbriimonadaceae bacterium]
MSAILGPWVLGLLGLGAGLLIVILAASARRNRAEPAACSNSEPGYRLARLLTRHELLWLAKIRPALPPGAWIAPKVRMADVLLAEERSAFVRVAQKHFDFVVYLPEDGQILAAIEIDDASHRRPSRRDRDRFVDKACRRAGLPLVRLSGSPRDLAPHEIAGAQTGLRTAA